MVVKPSCIAFYSHWNARKATTVILLDASTKISKSNFLHHRNRWMVYGIYISTSTMHIEIDTRNTVRYIEAFEAMQQAHYDTEWTKSHRYDSYAPMRPAIGKTNGKYITNKVKALIDGEEAFDDMLKQLQKAQNEIYIAGWWVTPDYYLQRPIESYPLSRLDTVLLSLAQKGVLIYILLYKESTLVLPNDSQYTKKKLNNLHPNIRVLRHPFLKVVPRYWYE